MAYPNFYNPYPQPYYNPPMPDQLAQLRQGQYQQPPMPSAQQPLSSGVIWVQGEEGAKGYLVSAGNSVMLMDSEASTFYLKSSDPSGMPLPLRVFDYTERTMSPKTPNKAAHAQEIEYVTRDEFNALAAKLEALTTVDKGKTKKDVKDVEEGTEDA